MVLLQMSGMNAGPQLSWKALNL